ncbi:MAG: hypothetical protein A2407_02285 [Candidatus Moranbacteria bacterium RIFOXYC1_FULL_44_8]|nr:MAG: hypothetical protein A2194_00895 [Candidatus Moranbacteria bacterium RIFOXYA1_FULL_44_8]OGI36123.1 MAG: hypothetical protein A2407_02285 [Candidatus Moranbacteria bacterium RIFOXYC1_FULL_44_8]OGI41727.1 MAG: hypothetical protein A2593_01660 [Candidatus Moranbacteria bacterium RIFOXYD1_FULL_44_9]
MENDPELPSGPFAKRESGPLANFQAKSLIFLGQKSYTLMSSIRRLYFFLEAPNKPKSNAK